MTAIGACLREAREAQGKSLDEAASITRIGKNYLLAIEGGMFDKLPNTAYVKGFLRIYARYLGLSDNEVVARFEESMVPAAGRPAETAPPRGKTRVDVAKDRPRGQWLAPAVLLILVLTIALFMGKKDSDEKKSLPPALSEQTAVAPLQPPRTSATTAGRIPSAPPPQATAPAPGGEGGGKGIILKLKVNQDSQLNITIDDVISQPYDLKAGDLIEWKAEKSFTLDLSNAGGIEAEFNGKQLKAFGEPGKSAHIVLKEEGT